MIVEGSVRAAMASDRGLVRQQNEDACLVDPLRRLFIVADGMGGQQAGAVAAQLVISALPDEIDRALSGTTDDFADLDTRYQQLIRRAVLAVSAQVSKLSAEKAPLSGMGATVVVAMLAGGSAHIVHLGDSRAYLFRARALTRLTADHNLAALLLQTGEISEDEAAAHPGRHRLTQHVGMAGEAVPDVQSVPLQHGDRLLLCTDGLTGMLHDTAIGRILEHDVDPHTLGQQLVDAANLAGGRDNVTVVLIDV